MSEGRGLRIGGYISGSLLIFFGVAVIVLGVWGFAFTRDHIEREGITFGPIEDPAVAEHAPDWAGEPVDTGRKALANTTRPFPSRSARAVWPARGTIERAAFATG
jgi:hypothetical protein